MSVSTHVLDAVLGGDAVAALVPGARVLDRHAAGLVIGGGYDQGVAVALGEVLADRPRGVDDELREALRVQVEYEVLEPVTTPWELHATAKALSAAVEPCIA